MTVLGVEALSTPEGVSQWYPFNINSTEWFPDKEPGTVTGLESAESESRRSTAAKGGVRQEDRGTGAQGQPSITLH